ncbi:DUF899 family protein [Actinomadura geliboluensis]|uniref:DUF899 family protein n=1 Tax=Actinomadura geliboluensis TaxID=882440 RepID=UPI00371D2FCC
MTEVDRGEIEPMWPEGAGEDYIAARIELARAERRLRDQVEAVAAARRRMPPGRLLDDYVFAEGPRDLAADGPVTAPHLADLFGEHDTLLTYHLMFHPDEDQACSMCSMWVDGFHGVSHHLARHGAFVVVSKAPLPKLRAWARRRGWDGLRILSSHGTTFNRDMNTERAGGVQRPVFSVLRREDAGIRHFYSLPANHLDGTERGIDLLSPVWNVLDLTPGGRGDWYADNDYPGRARG